MNTIRPFTLHIKQDQLNDLQSRLKNTRWPESETVLDWSQGVPLEKIQNLCTYWQDTYDWRRCETEINQWDQFTTTIDGLNIHFMHIKSPHPNATPLLITHGWPGSIIEFLDVIERLTDPVKFGGSPQDAFHLVIPSLPGFGFSEKPSTAGWGVERIAKAWIELMDRLNYENYFAQGGDWGAIVTTAIGAISPKACAGIHLNMPLIFPTQEDMNNLSPRESAALASMQDYQNHDSGYAKQQGTRPQTLSYGLTDSPSGQAAWIYEKFYSWVDHNGTPEDTVSYDKMLDNITLYWLSACAGSSGKLYWESILSSVESTPLSLPVGVSIFPKEIFRPSKRWAEKVYSNIIHWNELDKGGHFAALEQPKTFVQEIQACFRSLR